MTPQEMTPMQRIAATALGEDRGDGEEGMTGVVCVADNRAKIAAAYVKRFGRPHPEYGTGTIDAACIQGCEHTFPQFDCWKHGDPNRPKLEALNWTAPTLLMKKALSIAQSALAGTLKDITKGATHYKATGTPWPKDWGPEQATPLAVIGRQEYWRLP
jgi:hypothetical protein